MNTQWILITRNLGIGTMKTTLLYSKYPISCYIGVTEYIIQRAETSKLPCYRKVLLYISELFAMRFHFYATFNNPPFLGST